MKTLFFVGLALIPGILGVQIRVPVSTEECFFVAAEKGTKLTGSFEVLDGGMNDIDCSVAHSNGGALWGRQRQRTGTFDLIAPANGEYKLCFSNTGSTRAEKTVAFSLHVGDRMMRDIALKEHVTPLDTEVSQLVSGIQAIQDEQKYYWARERSARDTNEATNARVMWFAIGEMGLLLAVAALQGWALIAHFGASAVLGMFSSRN